MRFPLLLYADGGRDGGDWRVVYQFGMAALLLVVMHLSLFYCVSCSFQRESGASFGQNARAGVGSRDREMENAKRATPNSYVAPTITTMRLRQQHKKMNYL